MNKLLPDFLRGVSSDVLVREIVVEIDGIGGLELMYSHMRNANKNLMVGDWMVPWLTVIHQELLLITQKCTKGGRVLMPQRKTLTKKKTP